MLAIARQRVSSGNSPALSYTFVDVSVNLIGYRMLSRPYAFNYILRLRTSTEFKLGHSIAFQYTVVVPPEELSSLGLVSPSRT
ncbi:hypothetical protein Gotur_009557 [Gossypium turneri]